MDASDNIEHYFRRDDVQWAIVTPILAFFSYQIWESVVLTIGLVLFVVLSVSKVRKSTIKFKAGRIYIVKKRIFRKDWERTIPHESIKKVIFITTMMSSRYDTIAIRYMYEGKERNFSFNYFNMEKPERLVKYFSTHSILYDFGRTETKRDMEWRAEQL